MEKVKALLVVDVQNDFTTGSLAVPDGRGIVAGINRLIAERKERGYNLVVATQDWHPAGHISFASTQGKQPFQAIQVSYGTQILWPDHCVQESWGAAFDETLTGSRFFDVIIRKGSNRDLDSYSGFFENDKKTPTFLANLLAGGSIDIVGIATDVCVKYTALDAARSTKAEVRVLQDLCRGVTKEGHEAALLEMQQSGIRFK
jgi:nicotinamidase/pyrazinamidase